MKHRAVVLSICLMCSFLLAAPEGFRHWSASELKAYEQKLAAQMGAQQAATEQLGQFGRHSMLMAHRQASGEAEVHESVADVFIVQTGEGVLVVGGVLVEGRTLSPGELRGKAIEGGEKRRLEAGDVAQIPAGVPHQMLVEPGRQVTYLVVKIPQ
jgi:mannose-6-phosphate isomerase-like protein (cupin superfamily)